jgi:hypothetical protein
MINAVLLQSLISGCHKIHLNPPTFACLAMAAEMSTGVLAMAHVYKRKPAISMLVVKMEAEYFKKATGKNRIHLR